MSGFSSPYPPATSLFAFVLLLQRGGSRAVFRNLIFLEDYFMAWEARWGLKPDSAMQLMEPTAGPAGAESPVVAKDMASDQFR